MASIGCLGLRPPLRHVQCTRIQICIQIINARPYRTCVVVAHMGTSELN